MNVVKRYNHKGLEALCPSVANLREIIEQIDASSREVAVTMRALGQTFNGQSDIPTLDQVDARLRHVVSQAVLAFYDVYKSAPNGTDYDDVFGTYEHDGLIADVYLHEMSDEQFLLEVEMSKRLA